MNKGKTAGYSGTPLVRKFGIKEGHAITILNAPKGFDAVLEDLPDAVAISRKLKSDQDVILFFTASAGELEFTIPKLRNAIRPAGMIWICWPKKSSGVPSEITEDTIRRVALHHELVDIKVCAVDATWSGLKLVIPLKER